MRVEYELDQWEWRGVTRSIEVDPEDYEGIDADEIKRAVYDEIRRDAEQHLHLVYEEDATAQEILSEIAALQPTSEEDRDDG